MRKILLIRDLADEATEEYPFSAQKINEFDKETGEVVWSWDPHDYFNRQETDCMEVHGGTRFQGIHDWCMLTHFLMKMRVQFMFLSSHI